MTKRQETRVPKPSGQTVQSKEKRGSGGAIRPSPEHGDLSPCHAAPPVTQTQNRAAASLGLLCRSQSCSVGHDGFQQETGQSPEMISISHINSDLTKSLESDKRMRACGVDPRKAAVSDFLGDGRNKEIL